MNKKERRTAVLVEGKITAICVFRGQFLEHLFLGKTKNEVLLQFKNSSVSKEVNDFSSSSSDLEEVCRFIVEKISQKINKVNS
ncbi:hypothetical protein [Acidianus sp. HS-5]|uniref:hypothetical protein n=1 Tax=Acidianus sp. HS-5 TaxID=2886040 RepID=UPI001F274DE0|nr:hypothetical protein [Acidianus sp. HS-5]BDC19738.1 hypothetical protein HS5_26280 [Acidianus sp. HS-5]